MIRGNMQFYLATFGFILLAVSNGKIINDALHDEDMIKRYRRGGPSYNSICDDWSDWINDYYPDEVESLSQDDLDWFCPSGGNVTALRCKDSKGEPFSNKINETSGDGNYMYSCIKPMYGASCYPIRANVSCPDFSISLYCTCTPTTLSLVTKQTTPPRTTRAPLTTLVHTSRLATNETATSGGPRRSLLLWLIPTIVAVVVVVGCCVVLIISLLKKKKNKNKTKSNGESINT